MSAAAAAPAAASLRLLLLLLRLLRQQRHLVRDNLKTTRAEGLARKLYQAFPLELCLAVRE